MLEENARELGLRALQWELEGPPIEDDHRSFGFEVDGAVEHLAVLAIVGGGAMREDDAGERELGGLWVRRATLGGWSSFETNVRSAVVDERVLVAGADDREVASEARDGFAESKCPSGSTFAAPHRDHRAVGEARIRIGERLGGDELGLVAFAFAAISGCAVTEQRAVSPFDRVEIRGGVHARIEVDPSVTVTTIDVKGDDNLVRKVRTRVDDGELTIDTGDLDVDPELPLEVTFKTAKLTQIDAAGGSRVDVKLETGTLKVSAVGSATIVSRGRVHRLEANIAGSGRLEARYLVAETVDLDAAGKSFAAVCATNFLKADIAGDSEADYYCDPNSIDRDVSSGSHVHAR